MKLEDYGEWTVAFYEYDIYGSGEYFYSTHGNKGFKDVPEDAVEIQHLLNGEDVSTEYRPYKHFVYTKNNKGYYIQVEHTRGIIVKSKIVKFDTGLDFTDYNSGFCYVSDMISRLINNNIEGQDTDFNTLTKSELKSILDYYAEDVIHN
jgi:hypothetical protein